MVILASLATSIVTMTLQLNRHLKFEVCMDAIKYSYSRSNLLGSNLMSLRIISNIANGYEPNQNRIITNRFELY